MSSSLLVRFKTATRLGLGNVAAVISYRLRLKMGIHPAQRVAAGATPQGQFFAPAGTAVALPAPRPWTERPSYFGWLRPSGGATPPDWHQNPVNGTRAARTDDAWWTIADFDRPGEDIKAIWEASRFDWVVNFSQLAKSGSHDSIAQLNEWLGDWCKRNPPYRGPNWKCGQEASIRVLHLATAAAILDQTDAPLPALVELLTIHLKRIEPTIAYAMAQDNNHGTSEAAALFVGGSWLERLGAPQGAAWHAEGRKWLENRADRLIQLDGSFSQYSINYHRFILETFSIAEVWRRRMRLPSFSIAFQTRLAAATAWLHAFVSEETGDAPTLGPNDGANLLPLTDADYRDFRPAVQLATALFEDKVAYVAPGFWQSQLQWLGVAVPNERVPPRQSRLFDDGGYAVLYRGNATAVLRYPRFRFRPGHADALHVDLAVAGENLLRGPGSFSYSADPELRAYFSGTRGHNTAQFDDRDQMPRLGRFLWGAWLDTKTVSPISEADNAVSVSASYEDAEGASHRRRLTLGTGSLVITDELAGFSRRAVVRWRLRPGQWTLSGASATDGLHTIAVSASVPIVRCEIVAGWESRYYLQKTPAPVLEVEVSSPGTIETEYRWMS